MGSVLFIGCVVYAGLCLSLYLLQERLVFHPSNAVVTTPKAVGLVYEDVYLRAGDARIHAWYVPAENAQLSVLFCHGNAGNISHRLETLSLFNSLGVNILIFDCFKFLSIHMNCFKYIGIELVVYKSNHLIALALTSKCVSINK